MIYAFAITLAAIGATVIISISSYFKLKASELGEYISATRGFFASARPLVEDDETPTEILELISVMNDAITDKRAAVSLLRYLVRDRWMTIEPSVTNKIVVEFLHRRQELEAPFKGICINWFRAITSLSPLAGMIARAWMTERNIEGAIRYRARTSAKENNNKNLSSHGGCVARA